jgi:hypothetical protein
VAFVSREIAEARLIDTSTPLTQQDVSELVPWMALLSDAARERLKLRLTLEGLQAVRAMDQSSTRFARSSLALNVALFLLSIMALGIALKSYRSAEASGAAQFEQMKQQQQALDSSRQALEASLSTFKQQQKILDQLSKTAQNQLAISAVQAEREARKPELTAVMLYPSSPAILLHNTGNKTTFNPSFEGRFWDTSKPEGNSFRLVSSPNAKCDYILPKTACGPFMLNFPLNHPDSGDALFGYVSIQCPECSEFRVCWVYIANNRGFYAVGSYADYDFMRLTPTNIEATISRFLARKDLMPIADRLM